MAAVSPAEMSAPESPRSPLQPNTLTPVTALARFEFEPGSGNEGTKILMVEWEDENRSRASSGSYSVSWSGKTIALPADDPSSDNIRRAYFLLPPKVSVPPHLTILYQPAADKSPSATLRHTVFPLPAIFTPELGANAKASGKKGVLHTIWAKKRLQVLAKEIQREQDLNLEGIALQMALEEKEWIENNFGLAQRPSLDLSAVPKSPTGPKSPALQSPRSPGGRRLSEKLRGLSIATDDKGLKPRVNTPIRESHPLSPDGSDVAYSSFNSFRNGPLSPKAGTQRKIVAQAPPQIIKDMQRPMSGTSLGFAVQPARDDDNGDDLFAVALNPRSPDIPKSPFSFSSEEVAKFKGKK